MGNLPADVDAVRSLSRPTDSLAGRIAPLVQDLARLLRSRAHAESGLVPLPDSERDVLRFVRDRPGVGVGAVAAQLGMQPSNVSASVRALIGRGLLTRDVDPADRRCARLALTPAAHDDLTRLAGSWDRQIESALARLPASDRAALGAAVPALAALGAALREERHSWPP